jgi:hypothetical protein
MEGLIQKYMETQEALSVPVKISHHEVDRITINRLIGIRNSMVNKNNDMSHFDKVLRFFLTDEEFKIHVVGNKLFNPNK